jgi:hypothetical protein
VIGGRRRGGDGESGEGQGSPLSILIGVIHVAALVAGAVAGVGVWGLLATLPSGARRTVWGPLGGVVLGFAIGAVLGFCGTLLCQAWGLAGIRPLARLMGRETHVPLLIALLTGGAGAILGGMAGGFVSAERPVEAEFSQPFVKPR